MLKKLLKFFGLVVVVALASFGVSLLVSGRGGDDTQTPITGFQEEPATFKAPSETETTRKLTNEDASFPFLMPNGTELRYYHARSGEIKSLNLLKAEESPSVIAAVRAQASRIVWANSGIAIIATYPNQIIATNLITKTSKVLDKSITGPIYSPDGTDAAYLYFEGTSEEGTISIADVQFENFKNVLKTRLKTWELQWPRNDLLSLVARTGESLEFGSLYTLEIQNKKFIQAIDLQKNLEVLWSPDSSHVLFSRETRRGMEISLLDTATINITHLKISTRASKCVWKSDSTSLYCALPDEPLKSENLNNSEDSFIEISLDSLDTKPQELISTVDAGLIDARNLIIAPALQSMIFRNFKDGRLYSVKLSQ